MSKKSGMKFAPGSPVLKLLGILEPLLGQGSFTCSFCDKPLDKATVTEGRGPLRRSVEKQAVNDPTTGKLLGYEDKVKFTSSTLRACPDCSLNLTEKVGPDGKVYGAKTKFPAFD